MNNEIFKILDSKRKENKIKVIDLCRLSKLSCQAWINIKKNDNYTISTLSKFCNTLQIKEITLKFD